LIKERPKLTTKRMAQYESERNIQFVDRYSVLGIPRPNPETICGGNCEGTGWYPEISRNDQWLKAHLVMAVKSFGRHLFECEGWHFLKCETCGGTGRIKGEPSVWGERRIRGE
jgi:hypothetical protein